MPFILKAISLLTWDFGLQTFAYFSIFAAITKNTMSALSNRINNLSESATIKMAKMGRELAAKGVDVISLSFGEPDFHTPEHITHRYQDIPSYVKPFQQS